MDEVLALSSWGDGDGEWCWCGGVIGIRTEGCVDWYSCGMEYDVGGDVVLQGGTADEWGWPGWRALARVPISCKNIWLLASCCACIYWNLLSSASCCALSILSIAAVSWANWFCSATCTYSSILLQSLMYSLNSLSSRQDFDFLFRAWDPGMGSFPPLVHFSLCALSIRTIYISCIGFKGYTAGISPFIEINDLSELLTALIQKRDI